MPKCIAKNAHWYAGRDRVVGETFEVEAQHVVVLTAMGHIDVEQDSKEGALATAEAGGTTYLTREMTAQSSRKNNRKATA